MNTAARLINRYYHVNQSLKHISTSMDLGAQVKVIILLSALFSYSFMSSDDHLPYCFGLTKLNILQKSCGGSNTTSSSSSSPSPSKVVLYSYWLSSCSWRIRFALCLKGSFLTWSFFFFFGGEGGGGVYFSIFSYSTKYLLSLICKNEIFIIFHFWVLILRFWQNDTQVLFLKPYSLFQNDLQCIFFFWVKNQ